MEKSFRVLVNCMTYNHSNYILDALNGFSIQKTNFPYVCVVIDDSSTDGEQGMIMNFLNHECDMSSAEYNEDDTSACFFVRHKTNKSCFFSVCLLKRNLYREFGIKEKLFLDKWRAKVNYEAFCEGDDYWIDPQKLQKQVNYLEEHQNIDLVFTNINTFYQGAGMTRSHSLNQPPSSYAEHLRNAGFIAPCTWVYRSKVCHLFTGKRIDTTFIFALELFARSSVAFIDEVTAVYRDHSDSASHQKDVVSAYAYRKDVYQSQMEYYAKYPDLVSPQDLDEIERRWFFYNSRLIIANQDKEQISKARRFWIGKSIYKAIPYFLPVSLSRKIMMNLLQKEGYGCKR